MEKHELVLCCLLWSVSVNNTLDYRDGVTEVLPVNGL